MGFGLHIGWAIEGAIGSPCKVLPSLTAEGTLAALMPRCRCHCVAACSVLRVCTWCRAARPQQPSLAGGCIVPLAEREHGRAARGGKPAVWRDDPRLRGLLRVAVPARQGMRITRPIIRRCAYATSQRARLRVATRRARLRRGVGTASASLDRTSTAVPAAAAPVDLFVVFAPLRRSSAG
jgi:hypothetical protein